MITRPGSRPRSRWARWPAVTPRVTRASSRRRRPSPSKSMPSRRRRSKKSSSSAPASCGSRGTGIAAVGAGCGTPATSSTRESATAGRPATTVRGTCGSKATGVGDQTTRRPRARARARGLRVGVVQARRIAERQRLGVVVGFDLEARPDRGIHEAVRAVSRRRPRGTRRTTRRRSVDDVPRERDGRLPRRSIALRPAGHVDGGVRQARVGGPLDEPRSTRARRVAARARAARSRSTAEPRPGDVERGAATLREELHDVPRRHRRRAASAVHLANAQFLEIATDAFLRYAIESTGRPGTKMEAWGGKLGDQRDRRRRRVRAPRSARPSAQPAHEPAAATPTGKEPLVLNPQRQAAALHAASDDRFVGRCDRA